MRSVDGCYFQWPWQILALFSRSRNFWSRISQKRCILGTKLLKNTNRKLYTTYRMIPLSMTFSDLWPQFFTTFFDIEYLRNDTFVADMVCGRYRRFPSETTRDRAIVTIERQYEVICALSNGDLEWPLTQISRSRYYWRRISQKRCMLETKFL